MTERAIVVMSGDRLDNSRLEDMKTLVRVERVLVEEDYLEVPWTYVIYSRLVSLVGKCWS